MLQVKAVVLFAILAASLYGQQINGGGGSGGGGGSTGSITGSGLTAGNAYWYNGDTLTPASAYGLAPGGNPTALTVTFTNSSASIGATNTLIAGTAVQFQTTGSLCTGLSPATTYFVIATGLSGSAFRVSATYGGSAITCASGGSGTQTVTVVPKNPAVCVASSTTVCVFSGAVTTGTWTAGGAVYLSNTTDGALTQTLPSTSGHFVQVVGVAQSTTAILVMPSLNVVTLQ